jgi:hypothetical protein
LLLPEQSADVVEAGAVVGAVAVAVAHWIGRLALQFSRCRQGDQW